MVCGCVTEPLPDAHWGALMPTAAYTVPGRHCLVGRRLHVCGLADVAWWRGLHVTMADAASTAVLLRDLFNRTPFAAHTVVALGVLLAVIAFAFP